MTINNKLLSFIKINIKQHYSNKSIINYKQTNYNKTALLSYIVHPFKRNSFNHTNYFEAQSWANILFELGYNIDIIDYTSNKILNLSKYDLICGFGDVFQHYFEGGAQKNIKTIYYGTGMHVCHQNHASLQRVRDVYEKKGVWLGKSARFVEKTWTHQTALVDGIVALGNNVCAESYRQYYKGTIFSVPATFYATQKAQEIINQRKPKAKNNFLWFGSSGLVHKGLDLLLDYFVSHPELTLHICGPINNEPDFVSTYHNELFNTSNIRTYGFVDINSEAFCEILKSCGFVIFPSCAEGGCSSVLTAIGNGGLVPLISKETTISTGHEIWIEQLNKDGIEDAISRASQLTQNEIIGMQYKNLDYVLIHHSKENYYKQLRFAIENILGYVSSS